VDRLHIGLYNYGTETVVNSLSLSRRCSTFTEIECHAGKEVEALFIYIADDTDRKATAYRSFSAPLAFNSAVLPLVRCYSFDVPGE